MASNKHRSFRRVSKHSIRQAAHRIAESVHPKKIILFGSYVYGQPTQDSDVDFLLIIKERTRRARRETSLKASQALYPRLFPVDIVVRSAHDIRPRINAGDFFLQDIIEKGRVLFEQ